MSLKKTILDVMTHGDLKASAKAVDCPEPAFDAGNFVTVTFRPSPEVRQAAGGELGSTPQVTPEVTDQVTDQVPPQLTVIKAIFGEMSRQKIQESLGLKHTRHFRDTYLKPTVQTVCCYTGPQRSERRMR